MPQVKNNPDNRPPQLDVPLVKITMKMIGHIFMFLKIEEKFLRLFDNRFKNYFFKFRKLEVYFIG